MSETKWTPGKWMRGQCLSASENHHGWRIGTATYPIAEVYPLGSDPSDEGTANSHLIAAAPDLYAALDAYSKLDEQRANCEECGDRSEMAAETCGLCFPLADDARLKMRAALAAARGESACGQTTGGTGAEGGGGAR